jgi:magnesium transporter
MTRDYLSYSGNWTVEQVIDDLRSHRDQYAGYNVQYAYVLAGNGKLSGILRMRDLLLGASNRRISDLMIRDIVSVRAEDPLEKLYPVFQEQKYLGLPVLDGQGYLVGVIIRDSVFEAREKRDQHTFLKMSGILGGEELRSMPLYRRVGKRLSWLSLNVFLNVLAASVIAIYQDTISAAVVLAVFLPIISDMSGCSGNQAVAVSIRELSNGLVRPFELGRVFLKEIVMGLVNGVILGLLISFVAILWKGNLYLGLVVGVALALNTVLSVCLGGLLPLVLKRMKMDPALASGPILTTITDMCGFFFVLSFATYMLPRLVS